VTEATPPPAGHADRRRWNARYAGRAEVSFAPHPLLERALALPLPPGPVLDLACGASGGILLAAASGRRVTGVDVSDVALGLLAAEVHRRGLGGLVTLIHGDLGTWRPAPSSYALVICTGYWDRALFPPAAAAVVPEGALGWEAFTAGARRDRPALPAEWCLGPDEPASLLPVGFTVLDVAEAGSKRRLLAGRKRAVPVASA
jgi:SAM-dependent methyltransferase